MNIALNARTDYRAIIETVIVNSPDEVLSLKQAYQVQFKRSLEEDVASNCTGDLRKAIHILILFLILFFLGKNSTA